MRRSRTWEFDCGLAPLTIEIGNGVAADSNDDTTYWLRILLSAASHGDPRERREVRRIYQECFGPFRDFPNERASYRTMYRDLWERVEADLKGAAAAGSLRIARTEMPRVRIPLAPEIIPDDMRPKPVPEAAPTFFEARFVDEIGQSIGGLEVIFAFAGQSVKKKTDPAGIARLKGVDASFAKVRVASVSALAEIVEPRWKQLRRGEKPQGQGIVELPLHPELPSVPLESERQKLVVITPKLGKIFVELWDKYGRAQQASTKYKISGQASFEGTTDEKGRILHEDVPPGDYELNLVVEQELAGKKFSNEYRSAVVAVAPSQSLPLVGRLGAIPRLEMARIRGLLFDTNKCFLLPSAIPSLKRVREVYARNNPSELLVVGHTDRSGEPSINDAISVERADAVAAFLRDDVEPWLEMYGASKPVSKRWGSAEDLMMIQAMPGFATKPPVLDPIRWFQARHNEKPEALRKPMASLKVDGIAGPNTRKQLVSDYMDLDGATLDDQSGLDITITTHGCGENFPVDEGGVELDEAPEDNRRDQLDRRVELFFFDAEFGIQPAPPGKNSQPGSVEYREWRKRAEHEHIFDVMDPRRLVRLRVLVKGEPVKNTPFRLLVEGQLLGAGETDDEGNLSQPVPVEARSALLDVPSLGLQRAISLVPSEAFPSVKTVLGQQSRLQQLGFYVGPINGSKDAAFDDAVREFRKSRGIAPGSEIDEIAQRELLETYGS